MYQWRNRLINLSYFRRRPTPPAAPKCVREGVSVLPCIISREILIDCGLALINSPLPTARLCRPPPPPTRRSCRPRRSAYIRSARTSPVRPWSFRRAHAGNLALNLNPSSSRFSRSLCLCAPPPSTPRPKLDPAYRRAYIQISSTPTLEHTPVVHFSSGCDWSPGLCQQ